jgi:oligo-1,6-glucosidase
VNPNYKEINARQALADQNSIYNYFKKMIDLRKRTPALIYGDYKDLDPQNPNVFAYTRSLGADQYLVVLNLSKDALAYTLPEGLKAGRLALSNLDGKEENVSVVNLKGWEARIYKV